MKVTSAVWVFVVRGMDVSDGGQTGPDVLSTTQGQWEQLQAANGVEPGNEFIVYVADAAPESACFYIDAAAAAQGGEPLRLPRHRRRAVHPGEFTAPQDFSYRYLNGPTAETVAAWARAARLAAGLLTGHARRHRTRTRPG